MDDVDDLSCPLPGLRAPVEVLVDENGVPHLYAESEDDLFRAQGFNAARERLFQLDLWRRRGLGLLSEVFGERFVARDRAARLFLFRGDLRSEWLAYGSATKRIATAFVGGVNAYIDHCEENPERLPIEFREMGCRPGRWQVSDIAIIRSHGLFYNLEKEVARALVLRDFGPVIADLLYDRESADELRIPEGLDLSAIPDDVLHVYRLATSQPAFTEEDLPAAVSGMAGSNNWVVGGGRSATGRPLLANDPHRAIGLPSLRSLTHLSAPGLDVIGAGEPALPGVSIGHNGHVAFGLTIFPIDQEDLYCYETNPANPNEYRYQNRWEPMRVVSESIPVAGDESVRVELRFTRHGPVIFADPKRRTAFAVRAAWLETGMAPYLSSLEYLRSHRGGEFTDALNRWGAPGVNQLYATPDGDIGWRPTGLTPVRPNWDGALPVPGDGRYEWSGFADIDELPTTHNPDRDWLATANEHNLPADHRGPAVTRDWYAPFRSHRLTEILSDATEITVEDCVRAQADTVNVAARHVLAYLDDFVPDNSTADNAVATAVALLRSWDLNETVDSAGAALYQLWAYRHLRPALLRHVLTEHVPAFRKSTGEPTKKSTALPFNRSTVDKAVSWLLSDELSPTDVRFELAALASLRNRRSSPHRILADSLTAAIDEGKTLLGPHVSTWRWGDLHHAAPSHPLVDALPTTTWTRLAPQERGGSGDTVMLTAYDTTFTQTEGSSFRIVIDVGNWDNSQAMNTPGQSGRPTDPHWSDLYSDWAANRSFTLHYTRPAVEAHTTTRFTLLPASQPGTTPL